MTNNALEAITSSSSKNHKYLYLYYLIYLISWQLIALVYFALSFLSLSFLLLNEVIASWAVIKWWLSLHLDWTGSWGWSKWKWAKEISQQEALLMLWNVHATCTLSTHSDCNLFERDTFWPPGSRDKGALAVGIIPAIFCLWAHSPLAHGLSLLPFCYFAGCKSVQLGCEPS